MSIVRPTFQTPPAGPDQALRPLVRLLARQVAREIPTSMLKEKEADHEDEDAAAEDPAEEAGAAPRAR